jgi:hypothetical protein
MKIRLFKYLTIALATSLFFSSCIKDEVVELTDQGSTLVKVLEAPENAIFFSPFTTIEKVNLFSLRKDAPSGAELNTPTTITLTKKPELIDEYNAANAASFEWLPDSLYTLGESITQSGNDYVFNFAAGDFAREFTINLDGSKWDLAYKYAMAFTISNADGKKIDSGKQDILVMISIKNKWDGVYEVTGTSLDTYAPYLMDINTFLSSPQNIYGIEPPMQYELRTVSATKCALYDNYFYGGYYIPLSVDNGDGTYDYSAYGSFSPIIEFNPESNEVISVTNYYGQPASNGRSAELASDGINQYDEATKTMQIKFYMLQPPVIPDPPYIRVTFDQSWKYIGER